MSLLSYLPRIGGVVCGGIGLIGVCWYWHVRSIRSRFRSKDGSMIEGSNYFPFVDYLIYGFSGRNMNGPFGEFELSFILGFPVLMVSDPPIIKELLRGGSALKDYDKGELTLSGVEVIAGRQNLFSLDGSHWQHMRLIIDPAFRPNYIRLVTRTIVSVAEKTIRIWKKQTETNHSGSRGIDCKNCCVDNLFDLISNFTLDVICQVAFGISSPSTNIDSGCDAVLEQHPIMSSYKSLLKGLMMQMVGFGFFYKAQLQAAKEDIHKTAMEVLQFCRKSLVEATKGGPTGNVSLIQLLLSASASQILNETTAGTSSSSMDVSATNQLTDEEIIDNIKIFLFAGHDTTASTMLWVLYLLAIHPHYLHSIRAEVSSVDFTANEEVLYEELKTKLVVLQRVIKETLRLFPPAWAINRSPKKDLVLNGYSIPKGTYIMINTLRLHRREDLGWERPHEFIPERWDHKDSTRQDSDSNCYSKSSFAYLPFGGGPRSCVGQPLAELELLISLSLMLESFDPVLKDNSNKSCDIDYFSGATIRPKYINNLRLVARI